MIALLVDKKKKLGTSFSDGDWVYCDGVRDGLLRTEIRQVAEPQVTDHRIGYEKFEPQLMWKKVNKNGKVERPAMHDSQWSLARCRHATPDEIAEHRKEMEKFGIIEYEPNRR